MTIRLTSQVYVGQWPIFYGPANSCLEDYLLQKSCTWDDRSLSETAIVNYILLYIIVINFKIWLIFEVPSCDFADE